MLTCWGKLEEPPSTAMEFMEAAMDAGFEFGGGAPLLLRHGCRRRTEEDRRSELGRLEKTVVVGDKGKGDQI